MIPSQHSSVWGSRGASARGGRWFEEENFVVFLTLVKRKKLGRSKCGEREREKSFTLQLDEGEREKVKLDCTTVTPWKKIIEKKRKRKGEKKGSNTPPPPPHRVSIITSSRNYSQRKSKISSWDYHASQEAIHSCCFIVCIPRLLLFRRLSNQKVTQP